MNELPFTIKIRFDNKEIELSGSKKDVLETLNDITNIVDKVNQSFHSRSSTTTTTKPASIEGRQLPSISVTPDTPCPEAILKLLSTPWGRHKPRKLRELLEVMKVNAIHYPIGTVKGRLTDLTKKGVLRRIKDGREYAYIRVQ